MNNEKPKSAGGLAWFVALATLVVLGGASFYVWLSWGFDETPTVFGVRGDAMAPFAALLSAATLFAAIDGMRMQREELRLQRRELVLQRRELADSRKVMQEQAEAAKRSAETQERLAKSQAELADAQREANIVACLGHQGPVVAAAAHIDALIAAAKLPGMQGNVQREHISRHEEIRNQLATHLNEILTVQHALIEQRRAARKG